MSPLFSLILTSILLLMFIINLVDSVSHRKGENKQDIRSRVSLVCSVIGLVCALIVIVSTVLEIGS